MINSLATPTFYKDKKNAMRTHLVGSGSLFVLQWRDFLHIGFDLRACHTNHAMTTSRSGCHFGAIISREIVVSTTAKFHANVSNPRTKQSRKVMKTSVYRRKLLRICKSTENYMQTDVTKLSRLIFTVIGCGPNDTSNANQSEASLSTNVRMVFGV